MSAEIIHKGSGVLGNAPLPTDLELQELAVNYNAGDPALYLKDSAGAIRRVGGKASTSAAGAVQLTNALDSTSELVAPTAKALKEVNDKHEAFKDALRYAKRLYVDKDGSDTNNGSSPAEPLLTLRKAIELAQPGTAIMLGAGEYTETCPMQVRRNVGIFGDALRQVTIRPTEATKYDGIFEVDSGFYCYGCTFTGHQQGTHNGVYKTSWVVRFNTAANNVPIGANSVGAYITRSPYIQNCTSLTARQNDGQGGSTSTGVTGGGLLIDGSACAGNSPLRSMVVDSFTQINLGGPGCLIKNDGFAQLVSFFSTFCEYHVKCETGGQASISSSTSNFGTYSLVADGFSPSPIFTGTVQGATTSFINVVNLSAPRIGSTSRPLPGLLLRIGTSFYTVTGSVALTDGNSGYRVNFYPSLTGAVPNGTTVEFVRRSQISTGGHNMEYVGAGTNYSALPENGGIPIPANEIVETNRGRVFFISFDHLGNLRVGKGFDVDGASGDVTITTGQFNLAGLNAIGPFKRNGVFYGEQLQEVSNNTTLLSGFSGTADGNTVPTQNAVKTYVDNKFQTALINGENIKTLVSGTGQANVLGSGSVNFKTINGQTLIGSGDMVIAGGGGGGGSAIFRSTVTFSTSDGSPATMAVTHNSTSSYLIGGDTNPTLTLFRGRTYTLNVNALGHPFRIKTTRSTGQGDMYTTGVTNNGTDVGTITFVVPQSAPDTLYYQCEFHASMGGTINIANDGDTVGTVNLPRSGMLLSIQSTKAGWFRLYNRAAASTADATRARTEDPAPGSGVLVETIATGTDTIRLSPAPMISNLESPVTDVYSYRFKNDGTAGSAAITLNYLVLEA